MNVNVNRLGQVLETYRAQSQNKTTRKREALNTDRVEISAEAKSFEQARKAVRDLPEIREENIIAAQRNMLAGASVVPAAAVAQKILESI